MILSGLMALAGLACIFFSLRQPVTILVDGEPRTVTSAAFTVSSVLRAAGIAPASEDLVVPENDARFWNAPQIVVQHARPVTLVTNQNEQTLLSSATRVGNILLEVGIPVFPGDRLFVNGVEGDATTALRPGKAHLVQVQQAVLVSLTEGSTTTQFYSSASTLGAALWEAGIRPGLGDVLDPPANTPLQDAVSASLVRAQPVSIDAYGQTVTVTTAVETVGEALTDAGLALQGLDYCIPAEADPIPADRKIKLVRVQEKVALGLETLPFKTEYKLDPETELDQESVIQAGVTGLVATRERVLYENGQEVSRTSDGTWTARQPADAITGQGMKVVVRKLEGTDYEYWRKMTVYATSYSPCRVGGGRCSDHTAIGLPVQRGVVAVTLRWFRDMRMQSIYIPGYGKAVVGDTGGGIPGRYWIDLAFSDDDYESWHQWVTIYFLTPVPQYIPYILYP